MAQASSILAADFGSVQTRVVLIDVVDGAYRLVAYGSGITTIGYPIDDVRVGLKRILDDMQQSLGRHFFDEDAQLIVPEDANRNGVDHFITTASAGRPIRAVLVGLVPEVSLYSACRAVAGSYIEPVASIHLRDGLSEEERLNAIMLSRPDLIFISGGTDGGAENALLSILQTVRLALQLTDASLRPKIVYAGNNKLSGTVIDLFSELTPLQVAANVRPKMEREKFEAVQVQLGKAYDEHREVHGEGFATLGEISSTGVLPTAQSYALIAQYYASVRHCNLVAVDIGSTATVLVGAFGGETATRISTNIGVGHSAQQLLDQVGTEAIANWLPFYPKPNEIENYALNKSLRPASVPIDLRDLYLEHAFLRAGLRALIYEERQAWAGVSTANTALPVEMIVVGGAPLTASGYSAFDMLLIADCLQPSGVTEIKADRYGLLPALGAMASINSDAVVQLLSGEALPTLGTLISIDGQPQKDKKVANLTLITEDGERFKHELMGGHLWALPLPSGYTLKVNIRTAGGFSIAGKRRLKITLNGGEGGVIFDGRGRPLNSGQNPAERADNLPMWIHEVAEAPLQSIPGDWLIAPDAQDTPEIMEALGMFDEAPSLDTAPDDDAQDDLGDFFDTLEDDALGGDEALPLLDDLSQADDEIKIEEEDDFGSLRDLLN